MKFLRSIGLAALLMVGASGALAAPSVMDDSSGSAFGYRISFRADTADSERMVVTPVQCSVGVSHSGSGTVSLYQVATSATAASSGTLVATFTASTTSPTTFSPGLPFLKAVASVASDGTLMTIRCSNTQITKTDGVDVLIGGEDGVTDAANPNTSPIVCPKTNAACYYLSSSTGWWAAVSSNGVSSTSWSSVSEQVIYGYELNPSTGWDTETTYNTSSTCIAQRSQYFNTVDGACSANEWHIAWNRDVLLTSISASSELAQTGTDGCDFKLVEALTGTDVTNAELLFPASNTTIAAGDVVSDMVGTTLTAGTRYSLMYQDGSFCESGSGCNCGSGNGGIWFEMRGVYF